jgi:polysaccharide export outer membrane protein
VIDMKMTAIIAAVLAGAVSLSAAQAKPSPAAPAQGAAAKPPESGARGNASADYVIGQSDVLFITYRNEKDMTMDYLVRPDGKITVPLLGDVQAEGLTPVALTEELVKLSDKYYKNAAITVVVKNINSKKVSITGGVNKPGQYPILGPMNVVELISIAGGLTEFTSGKDITILRGSGSAQKAFGFNYKEVMERKNLGQNIPLQPGDSVLVPE